MAMRRMSNVAALLAARPTRISAAYTGVERSDPLVHISEASMNELIHPMHDGRPSAARLMAHEGGSIMQVPRRSRAAMFHSSPLSPQAPTSLHGEGGRLVRCHTGEYVWALGMRVTVKTRGEHTGGVYSAMEYHLMPGDGSDEHEHANEDEAWFILDGTLQWRFEDQVYEAHRGDFIHMPRGHRHSFHNASDAEAHMLVHCIPAGLENYFLEIGKPVDPDPKARKPPSTQEVARLASEAAEKYGLTFFRAVKSLKESLADGGSGPNASGSGAGEGGGASGGRGGGGGKGHSSGAKGGEGGGASGGGSEGGKATGSAGGGGSKGGGLPGNSQSGQSKEQGNSGPDPGEIMDKSMNEKGYQ